MDQANGFYALLVRGDEGDLQPRTAFFNGGKTQAPISGAEKISRQRFDFNADAILWVHSGKGDPRKHPEAWREFAALDEPGKLDSDGVT